VSTEQISVLIGGIQLLVAFILWLGPRSSLARRKAAANQTNPGTGRSKTVGLLLLGGFAFASVGFYRTLPSSTNPGNVEQRLKQWVSTFHLTAVTEPANPAVYFSLLVTAGSGNQVLLSRPKEPGLDRYVNFQATMAISPEHRAILVGMTKDQATRVIQELQVEMARYKIGFAFRLSANDPASLDTIVLSKNVPVTESFTEGTFLEHLSEMDNAVTLLRAAISLSLRQDK
jgi:hypothetical protein